MASIVNLRWKTSQELLADVDLDALYIRQVKAMGGARYQSYPYMLLVHTGKIMIGIDLGQVSFMDGDFGVAFRDRNRGHDKNPRKPNAVKETHE
jgi:hypothetical protein